MAESLLTYDDPRRNDPRTVNELISAALIAPDAGDDGYWDVIGALHWRGSAEVFDRAAQLCQSFCAVERRVGADILGQLGFFECAFTRARLNVLLKMLRQERDSEVVSSVLMALGHLREADAIRPVSRFCSHSDRDVRYAVVHALTGYDDALAIDSLIALTNDEDSDVRDWATFALGTQVDVDTPSLREALVRRLTDSDDDTRCEALFGLARRRDPRVIPALCNELASDGVGTLAVEAATEIADPQLHATLVALQGRWDFKDEWLSDAILACSPR